MKSDQVCEWDCIALCRLLKVAQLGAEVGAVLPSIIVNHIHQGGQIMGYVTKEDNERAQRNARGLLKVMGQSHEEFTPEIQMQIQQELKRCLRFEYFPTAL